MDIKVYLSFVADKINEAAAKGDKQEVIRLANVAHQALDDVIKKAQEQ